MEKKSQRVFWAIFMATFFAMFGETIPLSFQPQFIGSLGLSAAVVTLIYTIRNVIQTFLRLAAGSISDSLGKRNMMLFGLALFALVPFIYSVATNPWLPVVAMMASGLAMSIYFPPSEALASELFPLDQGVGFVQLRCPETRLHGIERLPMPKDSYDKPKIRENYANQAQGEVEQLKEFVPLL